MPRTLTIDPGQHSWRRGRVHQGRRLRGISHGLGLLPVLPPTGGLTGHLAAIDEDQAETGAGSGLTSKRLRQGVGSIGRGGVPGDPGSHGEVLGHEGGDLTKITRMVGRLRARKQLDQNVEVAAQIRQDC